LLRDAGRRDTASVADTARGDHRDGYGVNDLRPRTIVVSSPI
jgi:hypothetical protein